MPSLTNPLFAFFFSKPSTGRTKEPKPLDHNVHCLSFSFNSIHNEIQEPKLCINFHYVDEAFNLFLKKKTRDSTLVVLFFFIEHHVVRSTMLKLSRFQPHPEADFQPNLQNTAVFLIMNLMQIINFAANYEGHPFMDSIFENIPLLGKPLFV